MDNLIHLPNFEVETIVSTLKTRYKQDKIYTSIGLILVAINPFKQLGIYSNEIMSRYSRGDPLDEECPPHVFRTAALCYRGLREDRTNQSVVISGESGAGKSETTKLILEYLTQVAGTRDRGKGNLMDSNHILEALGNAKTIRNNNSSRFGKWMQVFFDKREVSIVGTTLVNFLLEKTRVVMQAANERNYHVFYQFCEGASPAVRKEYSLLPAKDFAYLNGGNSMKIAGLNDASEWELTLASLDKLNFSAADVQALQRVLSIVLHLGNLVIVDNAKDQGQLQNKDLLSLVARMMGVEATALEQVLLNRCVKVYSDVTWTPVSATAALLTRDALAKGLYGSLFDWVVKNIQNALAPSNESFAGVIGVLDIFGFELFQTNSLEQLFINYANEKLQQLFNQCVFKQEQQEYAEEGLKLGVVTFADNIQVCTLIDGRGGILRMVEEEGVVPSGSDEGLLQKLVRNYGGGRHPNFDTIKTNQNVFVVRHYAGEVIYDVVGFVEKNKDKVGKEVITLALSSRDSLIPSLFKAMDSSPTLSKGFQASLTQLNNILEATQLHFVRCIKPNSDKKPNNFQDADVVEQIHNAGLVQAVEIRKAGYSNRKTHKEFAYHYRCLAPKGLPRNANAKVLCEAIKKQLASSNAIFNDIQIGKSKVFWRSPQEVVLSKLRAEGLKRYVVILQRFLLVVRAKLIVRARRDVLKKCEAVLRTKDAKFAQDTLKAAELNRVQHPLVTKVRELLNLQKDMAQQITKLQQAIKGPVDKLPVALSEARQFNFSCPNKELQALIKTAETKVQAEEKKNAGDPGITRINSPTNRSPPSTVPPRMRTRPSATATQADVNVEITSPIKKGLNTAKPAGAPAARQFPLSSFSELRTKSSYIKGFHLNKEEQSARMLVWQDVPIMRSLTIPDRYEKEHMHPLKRVKSRRVCVDMHKNILGFMGDIRAVYPNPLGFQVLSTAFYNPLLRDELFCQLIKQTSSNPTSTTVTGRKFIRGCLVGLKLIFFCLCFFMPSNNLLEILTEHLQTFQPQTRQPAELKFNSEKDVASMCFVALKTPHYTVLPKLEDFSNLVNFAGSCDSLLEMLRVYCDWSANGGEGSCPTAVDGKEDMNMPELLPSTSLFATLTGPLRSLRSPLRMAPVMRQSERTAMSPTRDSNRDSSRESDQSLERRSDERPTLPARPTKQPQLTGRPCDCGAMVEDGDTFCSECGKKVVVPAPTPAPAPATPEPQAVEVRKCSNCGTVLEGTHKFCLACGTRVAAPGVDPVKLKRELQEREQIERESKIREEKARAEQERIKRETKEANERAERERESRERIERAKREKEEREERVRQEAAKKQEEEKKKAAAAAAARQSKPQTKNCRFCQEPMAVGERFCSECGKNQDTPAPAPAAAPAVSPGKKVCGGCGAENEIKFKFCLICGGKF